MKFQGPESSGLQNLLLQLFFTIMSHYNFVILLSSRYGKCNQTIFKLFCYFNASDSYCVVTFKMTQNQCNVDNFNAPPYLIQQHCSMSISVCHCVILVFGLITTKPLISTTSIFKTHPDEICETIKSKILTENDTLENLGNRYNPDKVSLDKNAI